MLYQVPIKSHKIKFTNAKAIMFKSFIDTDKKKISPDYCLTTIDIFWNPKNKNKSVCYGSLKDLQYYQHWTKWLVTIK